MCSSRFDPAQMEIRAVVSLDRRGNINPMPPAMIPFLQSTLRGALATLAINWQGMPQEDVVVPAGRFQAFKVELSSADGGPDRSTVWIALESRIPVKASTLMAEMGGATLSAELLP